MEMKEEWLMPGAVVPVDAETTAALVAEIKRLIGVVGDMALNMQPAQQQEPVEYVRKMIDALYENGDPVSVEAAELLERMTRQQQEPVAQLMDMIVGNLVREGINKHRARELAAHFIKHCNYTNGYCTGRTDLLKEQAEQKPVATLWQHGETGRTRITMPGDITDCDARWFKASDLYTTPPKREWQGLTDEEIEDLYFDRFSMGELKAFARAIEAKLKEKNT